MLFFEDFSGGEELDLGSWTVGEDEIMAFARDWDPQFFHVDPEAAGDGPFGGLVASGWHTGAIWMRLFVDAVLGRTAAIGPVEIEEMRWLVPTRPGDTLRGRLTVTGTTTAGTEADHGQLLFETELRNQRDEVAMRITGRELVARRRPPA